LFLEPEVATTTCIPSHTDFQTLHQDSCQQKAGWVNAFAGQKALRVSGADHCTPPSWLWTHPQHWAQLGELLSYSAKGKGGDVKIKNRLCWGLSGVAAGQQTQPPSLFGSVPHLNRVSRGGWFQGPQYTTTFCC